MQLSWYKQTKNRRLGSILVTSSLVYRFQLYKLTFSDTRPFLKSTMAPTRPSERSKPKPKSTGTSGKSNGDSVVHSTEASEKVTSKSESGPQGEQAYVPCESECSNRMDIDPPSYNAQSSVLEGNRTGNDGQTEAGSAGSTMTADEEMADG